MYRKPGPRPRKPYRCPELVVRHQLLRSPAWWFIFAWWWMFGFCGVSWKNRRHILAAPIQMRASAKWPKTGVFWATLWQFACTKPWQKDPVLMRLSKAEPACDDWNDPVDFDT